MLLKASSNSSWCKFVYPFSLPEHTAHEQQVRWHVGRVKQGRAVWSHAGQEGSCASTAILRGTAKPQTPQIRTGPLAKTHSWNQLRGQGWLGLTGTPLLNYHWWHWGVTEREQLRHKQPMWHKLSHAAQGGKGNIFAHHIVQMKRVSQWQFMCDQFPLNYRCI